MISARFTLLAAAALSCATLANAGCLVMPDGAGEVTAAQITAAMASYANGKLPNHAFFECTTLVTITLPAGFPLLLGAASGGDGSTFEGCTALTTVNWPTGVLTSMGNYVFKGCTALTSIHLPEGLTEMGYNVFYGCTALTCVSLPSVTTIGNGGGFTFAGCSSLTTVSLGAALTDIGRSPFYETNALTTVCGATNSALVSAGDDEFRETTFTAAEKAALKTMMKSACEGPFQTATCSFGTCATCTYLPAAGTSDYSLSKVVVHQGIKPNSHQPPLLSWTVTASPTTLAPAFAILMSTSPATATPTRSSANGMP